MKHYLILLGILFCIPRFATAQFPQSVPPDTVGYIKRLMEDPEYSYWEILGLFDHYIETTNDSVPTSFTKKFGRWDYFWGSRVDSTGNRYMANLAVLDASFSNSICFDGGDWDQADSYERTGQYNGVITAVYAPVGQGASPSEIFLGSNTGGMWHTIDGGTNWECMSDELRIPALGINSIVPDERAIDPGVSTPNVIYVATGNAGAFQPRYGTGLLKLYRSSSSDPWQWIETEMCWNLYNTANNIPGPVSLKVVMHPDFNTSGVPTPVFAIAGRSFWRSYNEGVNFEEINIESELNESWDAAYTLLDLEIVKDYGPANKEAVFVSLFAPSSGVNKGSRIFRSIESANGTLGDPGTWVEVGLNDLNSSPPSGVEGFMLATSAAEDGVLFVTGQNFLTSTIDLWRSDDLGDNFDYLQVNRNLGASISGLCRGAWSGRERPEFLVSPLNSNIMYFAENCLFRTVTVDWNLSQVTANSETDYNDAIPGSTSQNFGDTHADVRSIQIYEPSLSGADDIIIIGTDGGISIRDYSIPGGWTRLEESSNQNLVITQFFDIANTSTLNNFWIGGAQDNGLVFGPTQNNAFAQRNIGDGGQVIVSANDPNRIYAKGNHSISRFDLGPQNTLSAGTSVDIGPPSGSSQDPN